MWDIVVQVRMVSKTQRGGGVTTRSCLVAFRVNLPIVVCFVFYFRPMSFSLVVVTHFCCGVFDIFVYFSYF